MPKHTWIFAAVLSALVVAGIVGYSVWEQNKELSRVRDALHEAQSNIATNLAQAAALQERLMISTQEIARLEKEKAAVTTAQQSLEKEMRTAIESKDVTISELQGRLTVKILDKILFDSGEAALRPEGEAMLGKIAKVLVNHGKRQIHVVGHTDNVPIRANARAKFASNWELSTARATAAVRYLCEKENVDPHLLGALGYGEFRPVADNATGEGRAQNRRIEIVVLPVDAPAAPAVKAAPAVVPDSAPAIAPATEAPKPAVEKEN
jgi:chemotaxis protein MotB